MAACTQQHQLLWASSAPCPNPASLPARRRRVRPPEPDLTQVVGVGAVGEDGEQVEDGRELGVGQLRDRGRVKPRRASGPAAGRAGQGRAWRGGLTSRTAGMSSSSPKT